MMDNSVFLETLKGNKTSRPPVWFMRQAGRVLPSYNKLKENYTFSQLMEDEKLAAEVTLMPVHDLGVDAAILFSDILVVPETLGMELEFTDKGPIFTRPLSQFENPTQHLKADFSKLSHVYRAIDKIIETRPDNTPLIGFCGGPLTVFGFMFRGEVRDTTFLDAIKYFYNNKKNSLKILDALTEVSIEYAKTQAAHGIEAFQLFETYGGLLPESIYKQDILPRAKKILNAVRDLGVPTIYFPKDLGAGISNVNKDVADFVGVDWQTPIETARALVPKEVGLQGNLDPRILFASQDVIAQELEKYLSFGQNNQDWIFNLGHGVMPGIPVENVKFAIDWIKSANWNR